MTRLFAMTFLIISTMCFPAAAELVKQDEKYNNCEYSIEHGGYHRCYVSISTRNAKKDIRVVDGDTFTIKKDKIRIWGISAPEMDEPGGKESKVALQEILDTSAEVVCLSFNRDVFDRYVATCYLNRGVAMFDIAALMIHDGFAKDYPEYSDGYYSFVKPK